MDIGRQLTRLVAEPLQPPVPAGAGAPAKHFGGSDTDLAGRLVVTDPPTPERNGRAAAPEPVGAADV